MRNGAGILCAALWWTASVPAQTPSAQDSRAMAPSDIRAMAPSDIRAMAASCAACHGTDGNAVRGGAMPRLAGLRGDYFVRQMRSFRDGTRPATVMQQIAKGFDDAQTDALAAYFARVRE